MKPTPATLLLIRHGETAWNAEHRIQGSLDIPLSATGIWQAGRLAERLAAERIDAVYTSDLARAWLTAEPIAARHGVELRADIRLRERCFGVFEGHTLEEIAARWPAEFAAWRERDPAWAMPEGESGAGFIERVNAALHDIACAWAGATVAVIAHGGVLDVAYRTARALAWDAPREHVMANAAINRIAAAAPPLRLEIVDWGDVAHLSEARDETLT
ncbi:MAG: histidine phosphatase family protein [Burkholderiaceae bacterium]|nr:histidine phosphatase family protein [Burkholderiaceae bacterium]GIL05626.1 MAG: phosphoglycerate mutase [Betaproteobacteria bacterium]